MTYRVQRLAASCLDLTAILQRRSRAVQVLSILRVCYALCSQLSFPSPSRSPARLLQHRAARRAYHCKLATRPEGAKCHHAMPEYTTCR
ncbi:hypothetical protein C8T65DRAFT_656431 [Cerioporus squamosus]|nr:hypothetical protein C8T65DRAFT_656431 [Cerioporus squamosus]